MPPTSDANLTLFFGHFHPLLVHLPIGFLALLAILELANRIHHFKHAAQARGIVLAFTVASAVVAVVCGLLLASGGGYNPDLLAWHKWTGIGLAAACLLTAVSYWTKLHRLYAGFLMLTLLLLGPASHFGGSMTHGQDYLTEYAPDWLRKLTGNGHRLALTSATSQPATQTSLTSPADALVYDDLVRPILNQHCVSCHGPEKLKGELRLDSPDAIKQGGHSCPLFASSANQPSLLVHRLLLPADDQKHMPPAGKPQLTDDQIAILQFFADTGLEKSSQTLAALDAPASVTDAAGNLLGIAPPPAPQPLALDALHPLVAQLDSALGVVVAPVTATDPWVTVNASVATRFGDAQLAQLLPIANNITGINLAGTDVTDAGLATLAAMPNLTRIRLDRTNISDAGLRHLTQLRKLDYLNLYDTPLTDAALPTLKSIPSLRHIYLSRTQVTPDAAAAFASSIEDQTKIRRWQQQVALLESQIRAQQVEVIASTQPTSKPASTTQSATRPARKKSPSTTLATN